MLFLEIAATGYAFLVPFPLFGESEKDEDHLYHIFSCFFCWNMHSQTSDMSAILGTDQTSERQRIHKNRDHVEVMQMYTARGIIVEHHLAKENGQTRRLNQVAQTKSEQVVAFPLVRITTCGRLTIEVLQTVHQGERDHGEAVYGPPDSALLAKKGTSTAFTLLTLLVSQPGYFATKDWLSEKLGHLADTGEEEDGLESLGLKRVDNVVSRLRFLLFLAQPNEPPEATLVRRRLVEYQRASGESGPGYRLAGLPLLWLDVAEIEVSIKRARRLEQFGEDGLAEWQTAYDLAMGGRFLPGEVYSDWVEWRRRTIETQLWDCVQVLWHRFVELGEAGEREAVRILREYWQSHLTSEDALRPLLELLGKRECFGEAQAYYQQCCTALDLEDKQPDQRTRDIIEFEQAVQIQRKRVLGDRRTGTTTISLSPFLPENQQPGQTSNLAQTVTQDIIETSYVYGGQDTHNMVRRQFLQQLFGLVGMPFVLQPGLVPEPWSPRTVEAFLPQCETNILACWQLMRGRDLLAVHSLLLTWLPSLDSLVAQSLPSQKKAAKLAAQGYILAGLSAVLQEKMAEAEWCCRQAIEYSHISEDINLLVASLKHLATKYTDAHYPLLVLQTYQEALPCVPQVSPLLQSRIYLGLALAYAQCYQQREAESYLGLAQETFPNSPEADPSFLYADCGRSSLYHYGGLIALAFGQPQKAWDIFEEVHFLPSSSAIPERTRLEIINCQAEAAVEQQDLALACTHIQTGVKGASELKSTKRLGDVHRIYQKMAQVWPYESQVKQLEELFHETEGH